MPDQRFFRRAGPFLLSALAPQIGADDIRADQRDVLIHDLAKPEVATSGNICLFADSRYSNVLSRTEAAAIVTTHDLSKHAPFSAALLLVQQPRLAFVLLQQIFYPSSPLVAWIAPQATISPTAVIGTGCRIGPGAVIGDGVRLGANSSIEPNTVIGAGVLIGEACCIGPNVVISHSIIGDRVNIFANVTIGRPGFGFVRSPQGLVRMPQLGRVLIGDDVEIGSTTTIDRGTLGDTLIGEGTKIDNGVQVGHNVTIGRNCILAGHVGIAGSATLQDSVVVGGGVIISDHVVIGAGAQVAVGSCVIRNVAANEVVGGYPAVPVRLWHRQTVAINRLVQPRSTAAKFVKDPTMDKPRSVC